MWGFYDAFTAAQIELMLSDAPLVVYDRKSRRGKRKNGSAGKDKPKAASVSNAIDKWEAKYGNGKNAKKSLDLSGYKMVGRYTKNKR